MIDNRQRVYEEYERFFEAINPKPDWRDLASVVIVILGVILAYCWVTGY